MKLKEIDRTAMQAWSPAQQHPIYLATGEFFWEACAVCAGCHEGAIIESCRSYSWRKLCPEDWSGVHVVGL